MILWIISKVLIPIKTSEKFLYPIRFLIFSLTIVLFISTSVSCQENPDIIKLTFTDRPNVDTNFVNVLPKKLLEKKIALVLSGGGARGISQLGILKAFEDNKIDIDMIVGTSIGSAIGGLYSSGYSAKEILNNFKGTDWQKTLSISNKYQREYLFYDQKMIQDNGLLTVSLNGFKPVLPSFLSSGQNLSELINILTLNAKYHVKKDFNDLKIPFYSVATDFDNGAPKIISSGNISESIKASFTFPLLYSPTIINRKRYVDGGLTANIPVKQAKEIGADLTIAINTTTPLKKLKELNNALNTADQILSISLNEINKEQLAQANVVISPELGDMSTFDFSDLDAVFKKGYESAALHITDIKNKIDSINYYSSGYYNFFILNPIILAPFRTESLVDINSIRAYKDINFLRFSDIEKKLKELYNTGYYKNVTSRVYRNDAGSIVEYNLVPNAKLERVEAAGNFLFIDSLTHKFQNEHEGQVLNLIECSKLYEDILGKFRQNELSAVEITKFFFNEDTGTLSIDFSDGRLRDVNVTGNIFTKDNVIFREILQDKNDLALKGGLLKSLRNVYSTNLFEQASLNFNYDTNKYKPDLQVSVIEKNPRNLTFSAKSDNEKNLQLYVDIRDYNLLGTGNTFGITALGGLRNRLYKAEFGSNQFFSTPLTYNISAYWKFDDFYEYDPNIISNENKYERTKLGEFRDKRYGYSFLVGSQIGRSGIAFTRLTFENLTLQNITPDTDVRDEFNTFKLKFGINYDSRDIYPFAAKGSFLQTYFETSQFKVRGRRNYTKLFVDYGQYFPLSSKMNLHPRFVFGSADNTTPFNEEFSLGGERSFFGMVENEDRGRQIFVGSLEYRYILPIRIFFDSYVRLRYDIGRTWETTADIKFKDLRHGLGLSLTFDTPIGESSFSVGKSFLIQRGLTEDSFIFGPYTYYYSIGFNF